MQYKADKGYLVVAANNSTTDYTKCAEVLAKSLRVWHPDVKICLLTNVTDYANTVFDFVEYFGTDSDLEWKVDLDWQVYFKSPFHETIKIEADMLLTSPFDHWWTFFRKYDFWVSTGCKDHRGNAGSSRVYRQIFDVNHLPDVYNAITYFRKSLHAERFFNHVRDIFAHWDSVTNCLKQGHGQIPNTDLAYAVAIDKFGPADCTSPLAGPQITHMKPRITNTSAEDWSNELSWEIVDGVVRINGYAQHGMLHYHHKHLASEFEKYYE